MFQSETTRRGFGLGWIGWSSLAAVMSGGVAHAGVVDVGFELDSYGMTSGGVQTQMGAGDFGVVDLWATTNVSAVKLLNLFDVQVSLARGSFVHHDASEAGRWEASFTKRAFGADSAIDSFVTMGAFVGDDPFEASLDPNFNGAEAGRVSESAGWYNPDPFNDQGIAIQSRIFLGRFVFDQADVAGNTFSLAGSLGWKLDFDGAIVEKSTDLVSRTFPGTVVPGPIAMSVFGAMALVRRRRR